LLRGCLEADDRARLSSITIVDELRPYFADNPPDGNLLSDAVHQVLNLDTEGSSNKRKRLKVELGELVILCWRLLELGADPNVRIEHEASMVDQAVEFVNNQLEMLGASQIPGRAPCPIWKLAMVETLVSHLRDKGGHGILHEYDIRPRSYESFCAEPPLRRTEILLEVLQPKIVANEVEEGKPRIMAWLAENMEYQDLLRLYGYYDLEAYLLILTTP
jgi:hypothetical protein